MKLFESLGDAVAKERDYLYSSPIIADAISTSRKRCPC